MTERSVVERVRDRKLALLPLASRPRINERSVAERLQGVAAALLVFLIAYSAIAWRLESAPDLFSDEILYTRAGIRVATEGALIWDDGDPLFVHPPLYFLAEAAYLRLTTDPSSVARTPGDIFGWVFHARHLNAIFAGLTAVLLYWLGRRLHGLWLGILLVALFFVDPFGVRTNRRAMLETLAGLLTLAGMGLVLMRSMRLRPALAILAGLLLGLAILAKELAFTSLVAVLAYWYWQRRRDPTGFDRHRNLLFVVAVGGLTYLAVPLWAWTTGRWERFLSVKLLSLSRLLGLVQITGWNRPGVSLWDFLQRRLADYGSSYFLLGLGGLAMLWLLLRHRHEPAARLLGLWGLLLYPFYAFVALAGSGNDQFFYFLLVPAVLLVGYAATTLLSRRARIAAVALVALLLAYNSVQWYANYGVGLDNGYDELATYVRANLPAGEAINATGDAIKFEYFFPDRPITDAATPEEAQESGTRYFALAPKDVWARYRTTPELAAWIETNGERIFATTGDSYGDIYLYRVDEAPPVPDADPRPAPPTAPAVRFFPPADMAFIGPLVLLLGLWSLLLAGLAVWLEWRARPAPVILVGVRRERA